MRRVSWRSAPRAPRARGEDYPVGGNMEFQMRVSAAMTRADEYKAKAEEAERQASKAT